MMMNAAAASKPRPMAESNGGPSRPVPDESLLSQSLGNVTHRTSFHRSTSEIPSIFISGYLLKRSNNPHPSMSSLAQTSATETDLFEPRVVADIFRTTAAETDEQQVETEHAPQIPQHLQTEERVQSPIEQSLSMISSFFGLETSDKAIDVAPKEAPAVVTPITPSRPIVGIRSAPISVQNSLHGKKPRELPTLPFQDDDNVDLRFLSRGDSAPSVMKSCSDAAPADYIDPHDGHRWHSKYCVLEDGILYFYRNSNVGDSQEAKEERAKSCQQFQAQEDTSLSKSPTPRKLLNNVIKETVIWEKRVFLESVGAVRSADSEYGQGSFELLAVNDDDDDNEAFSSDKLILKARNEEEMREWLFQCHRYMSSLLRNIAEHVGLGQVPLGDIHHPSFAPSWTTTPSIDIVRINSFSPGHARRQGAGFAPSSLSHGHGQSALRRKRGERKAGSPAHSLEQVGSFVRSEPSSPSHLIGPEMPPEVSQPPTACPETERPPPIPKAKGKYIPPHLRNKNENKSTPVKAGRYVPPSQRRRAAAEEIVESECTSLEDRVAVEQKESNNHDGIFEMSMDEPEAKTVEPDEAEQYGSAFKLGGCADPRIIVGSIVDPLFTLKKESHVGQVHTEDYGDFGGGKDTCDSSLKWEIGAVSKCGVRDSNEDSYLVASNLMKAFQSLPGYQDGLSWIESSSHHPGLFAVFDGHNGNHAARYAAEKLPHFLLNESSSSPSSPDEAQHRAAEEILLNAIGRLDDAFCRLCTKDGRDWESGATALIALVAHEHLLLANLGDCRGMVCRSMDSSNVVAMELHGEDDWFRLDLRTEETSALSCFFREVTHVHKPSRPDELERIQKANGWVTTESEIPFAQVQRMDFYDKDVVEIVKRSSAPHIEISRVCGDLAVSRALGDHEYKAAFNGSPDGPSNVIEWDSPMPFLDYPEKHSQRFKGDLVSPVPELQKVKLAEEGVFHEFLLLACDGLWDVMKPDDAIRITRGLLFEQKKTAKDAAARLAELAIHLGSSDNITVIVVRFFKDNEERR